MDITSLIPYRTVTATPIEGRRWLGMNIAGEEWDVYVTTRTGWQGGHAHTFEMPAEDGTTSCTGCGAAAWSLTWVKPALHCTPACGTHVRMLDSEPRPKCGTGAWVKAMVDRLDDLVSQSSQHLLESMLGAVCVDGPGVIPAEDRETVVLAVLDPAERLNPSRSGITLPKMARQPV